MAPATFVVGVQLSFPGASYLVALDTLSYSTFATVLVVIGFCLVQLILLGNPAHRVQVRSRTDARRDRPRQGLGGRSLEDDRDLRAHGNRLGLVIIGVSELT